MCVFAIVCVRACVRVCVRARACVFVCVHECVHVCVHACIHQVYFGMLDALLAAEELPEEYRNKQQVGKQSLCKGIACHLPCGKRRVEAQFSKRA